MHEEGIPEQLAKGRGERERRDNVWRQARRPMKRGAKRGEEKGRKKGTKRSGLKEGLLCFVSVEAFDVFSQGEDLEGCGDLFW